MAYIAEFPPNLPPFFGNQHLNGGRVQSIAVNPANKSHIIAAHDFGGFWVSRDGGTTWAHMDEPRTVSATDAAFAPDGVTTVATTARDTRASNGGGIWISMDAGVTWTKASAADSVPGGGTSAGRISAYGISFALGDGGGVYVGTDYGVAVSFDYGATWNPTLIAASWVGARSVLGLPDRTVLALTGAGVYLSEDGGGSWSNIRPGFFAAGFKCLQASPYDVDKVFVLQGPGQLHMYERAAGTWTTLAFPGDDPVRPPFIAVGASDAAPEALDIWASGGTALRRVTCVDIEAVRALTESDWQTIANEEGLHTDPGHLGLTASGKPAIYGCDGGLFRPANDDGSLWQHAPRPRHALNSLEITDVGGTNVASLRSSHTCLYFTTQDNGIWASPDGGRTWPNSDCAEGFHVQVRADAASDEEVTVAYGNVGCDPQPNRFSEAHLVNPRAVPDVDTTGNLVTDLAQAFWVSPGRWLRYRTPQGSPEVWASTDNGQTWAHAATIALPKEGTFGVAHEDGRPVIYAPFQGSSRTNGHPRIGLIRFNDVFDGQIRQYGEADLMYLPNGGSLGVRATMHDWHAVYGVNPYDPGHIVAPDVLNGVVWVSFTGGASWAQDQGLTNAVTRGGELLLYDEDPYRMQVTFIAFHPYFADHIVIGTREAGVIVSDDGGNTWGTLPGSESILYATNAFFRHDGIAVVSTYGRGLWTIDFRLTIGQFPAPDLCHARARLCILREPADPRVIRKIDWRGKDVVAFVAGRINGMRLSGGRLRRLTVTPGTRWHRYTPTARRLRKLNIVESKEGIGFADLKGCLASVEKREILKAVVLDNDGKVVAVLSGPDEWRAEDLPPEMTVEAGISEPQPVEGVDAEAAKGPYILLATRLPVPGRAVLGDDGVLTWVARGFTPGGRVDTLLDGQPIGRGLRVRKDGSVDGKVQTEGQLSVGEHRIEVVEKGKDEEMASAFFVKAVLDQLESSG